MENEAAATTVLTTMASFSSRMANRATPAPVSSPYHATTAPSSQLVPPSVDSAAGAQDEGLADDAEYGEANADDEIAGDQDDDNNSEGDQNEERGAAAADEDHPTAAGQHDPAVTGQPTTENPPASTADGTPTHFLLHRHSPSLLPFPESINYDALLSDDICCMSQ